MNVTVYEGPAWNMAALEGLLPRHMLTGAMRYENFAPLGTGGKAEVLRCRDIYLEREVAYKALHPSLADSQIEQQMLMREARITAGLNIRAVPKVFEIGREYSGRPYFTMELLQGRSLHAHLEAQRAAADPATEALPAEEAVAIVVDAARALAQAHRAGLVHGDVKPENIFVGDDGFVHVIDWGLARILEQARSQGGGALEDGWGRQGSALFMSPEQAACAPFLSPASDIYSLGVVLYECLTGRVPFQASRSEDTLRMVATANVVPPSAVAPHRPLPPGVDAFCLRALAKDPQRRFATMDEFAGALIDHYHDLLVRFER